MATAPRLAHCITVSVAADSSLTIEHVRRQGVIDQPWTREVNKTTDKLHALTILNTIARRILDDLERGV